VQLKRVTQNRDDKGHESCPPIHGEAPSVYRYLTQFWGGGGGEGLGQFRTHDFNGARVTFFGVKLGFEALPPCCKHISSLKKALESLFMQTSEFSQPLI
jgi:hypothetical protein